MERNKFLHVRAAAAELGLIAEAAELCRMRPAEYVRWVLERESREIVRERGCLKKPV
jgi:hypothetical protein